MIHVHVPGTRPLPGVVRTSLEVPAETPFGRARAVPFRRPRSASPTLSVIFGTYERFALLKAAVESVRRAVGSFTYEICVCDGGSKDGSREWLAQQPDVVLVAKRGLFGAVDAFNDAFVVSSGAYIANFNDDALYVGEALARGVEYLAEHAAVGQVIFSFAAAGEAYYTSSVFAGLDEKHYVSETVSLSESKYANFGITRRAAAGEVAEIVGGFWSPAYYTYAADCELSLWVRKLGWKIALLPEERVVDVRVKDDLRVVNADGVSSDVGVLVSRWSPAALLPGGLPPNVSAEELARFRAVAERG